MVDQVGSMLAGISGDGSVTSAADYYPFGMLRPGRETAFGASRFGFGGYEKDDELRGLGSSYVTDARLYDSRTGRWLTPDPLFTQTPLLGTERPQELNPYAYARNHPVTHNDPTGKAIPLVIAGAALLGVDLGAVLSVTVTAAIVSVGTIFVGTEIYDAAVRSEDVVSADVIPEIKPTDRGRQSEERVLNDLDVPKNTDKVRTREGTSIPDYITDDTIGEVKDTKEVSRTKQIRIQQQTARETGKKHKIHTGDKTKVFRPVEEGGSEIIRRPDLGPQPAAPTTPTSEGGTS
jgi:RHS repeat-associated protein